MHIRDFNCYICKYDAGEFKLFRSSGLESAKKTLLTTTKPSPYNGRRPFADIEFCITFVNYQSCVYR